MQILLFGAGKSSSVLIRYLLKQAEAAQWRLIVIDNNLTLAQSKIDGHPLGTAVSVAVENHMERSQWIMQSSVVISMLPPALHTLVAMDCIKYGKHFLTASYIDDSLRKYEKMIQDKGLLFLCEMGLDPGIDHMSALQAIHNIQSSGGIISSFKSHCGGLVAPESDDNPWHYKISWNPQNIVRAGQTGAIYLENNLFTKKKYTELFEDCPLIHIPGYGSYACYPNRDSLSYADIYQLTNVTTFIRTTIRHPDFCFGWKHILKAGLTQIDDASFLNSLNGKTIIDWLNASIKKQSGLPSFKAYLLENVHSTDTEKLERLFDQIGLLSAEIIPSHASSSADILQYLIEKNWKLADTDKDMIIMVHEINYTLDTHEHLHTSTMIVKGENALETAMAKTVGLPLGIAAKLLLQGQLNFTGLHVPTLPEIYEPVLKELKQFKIGFTLQDKIQC